MDNIEKLEKEKEMDVFAQEVSSDELEAVAGGTKDGDDNRKPMMADRNGPLSPVVVNC